MSATRYQIFVATPPRLERVLDAELDAVGFPGPHPRKRGGTELYMTDEQLWGACHDLRTPEHLRVRIGSFFAVDFRELEDGFGKIPIAAYYGRGGVPPVYVTSTRSHLYHTDAVKERIQRYMGEFLDANRGIDDTLPALYVRIIKNMVVLSVDASGDPLYRRGIRTHVGDAPLRETLASVCLREAELTDAPAIWDPFCGSGVFMVERALAAPGLRLPRKFAFEGWKNHDADAYAKFLEGRAEQPTLDGVRLYGSERDGRMVRATKHNLQQAGASANSIVFEGDYTGHVDKIPQGTAIITNPPWGRRMGRKQVADIGSNLRKMLKGRRDLKKVFVLTGDEKFEAHTGLPWEVRLEFRDGGTPVRFLRLRRD